MGIVAAYTREFASRPMSFRRIGHWVLSHRMPPFDTYHTRMTTDTKLIDRFKEHEFFISGMGIMAGYTALSKNYAMNIGKRVFVVHKLLFIIMTNDTNHDGRFGP